MTVPEPAAFRPVRVVAQKWAGRPHWEFDAVLLGADEHGTWAGVAPGTRITRPGRVVVTGQPQVVLVPDGLGYVVTFYATDPPPSVLTYVDLTTVPVIEDARITSVDLDLDVIQRLDGTVFVDDEDEFDEHRASWGYPHDLVERTRALCACLADDLAAGRPPFHGVHRAWLDRLAGITAPPSPLAPPPGARPGPGRDG